MSAKCRWKVCLLLGCLCSLRLGERVSERRRQSFVSSSVAAAAARAAALLRQLLLLLLLLVVIVGGRGWSWLFCGALVGILYLCFGRFLLAVVLFCRALLCVFVRPVAWARYLGRTESVSTLSSDNEKGVCGTRRLFGLNNSHPHNADCCETTPTMRGVGVCVGRQPPRVVLRRRFSDVRGTN